MRRLLTLVLLAVFLSCVGSATALAQGKNIHIVANNEPIASVFKKLEKQTAYKVMYASADVYGIKVNKTIEAKDVRSAMDQIVGGTGLSYTIDKQFVTVKKASEALAASDGEGDSFVMNGKVYDESGLEVPGVTVMIVGTDQGTATDVDGRFTLKVKAGQRLKFSYIGYKEDYEEVKPVHNRRVMKVTIEPDSKNLDEVQVVAFGTQKKESVVSAITTVRPDDLKTSSSDLTTNFAGRVPGMIAWQTGGLPGALTDSEMQTKFYIRGITSFQSGANTDPLILIDNVESSKSELSRLAPEDIESFSVLKDASATAMYGARGANGVILVTTKKGTEGSVYTTFRYESVLSQPTQQIDVVDPITYMRAYNQALLARNPDATPQYSVERINRTIDAKNGKYPSWLYPSIDWYKQLFKNMTWNHHAGLNIRGGSRVVQYYAAVNYNRDEGMIKTDKLNDFSCNITNNQLQFRTNLNIDLAAGIQLVVNSVTTVDKYHGPQTSQQSAYSAAFNASPVDFAPTYPADDANNWPHILFGTTESHKTNPYAVIHAGYLDRTRYSTTNQAWYMQKLSQLVKGLEVRARASIVQTGYYTNRFTTNPYYYALTGYDQETGKHELTSIYMGQPPKKTLSAYEGAHQTVTNTTLTGMILHTAAWGGPDKNMHQTSLTGVAEMQNTTFTPIRDVLNGQPRRNLTFSARASYGFLDRYFGEFSFGYNGSERFAKKHRFGFFPAGGVAWIASSEPWMKKISNIVNYLKIRASYGKVGNDGIISTPRFVFLPSISRVAADNPQAFAGVGPYSRNIITYYANPNIQWEIAEQYNLGLDLKMFKGIFEMQADVYKEYRHNILSTRTTVPATVGIEVNQLANIGETYSRGVDLSAKIQEMVSKDFWFILNGTLTYNKVSYRKIEESDNKPAWQRRKGNEISQPIGYIAEGLFRDQAEIDNSPRQDGDVMPGDIKYRDLNNDGVIDVNDATYIGYPETPRLIYGFNAFINYKSWEFDVYFQGSGQRSFFMNPAAITPFYNDHALLKHIWDDHWSEDNQNTNAFWPRLSTYSITQHNPQEDWYNSKNNEVRKSSWFMRDCHFLRCTQMDLAYNLPMSVCRKIGLKNFKLYVRVNNPFIITNFHDWDVELGENGFNYPIQRTYTLGVNVSF